jgi:hypothetical protein
MKVDSGYIEELHIFWAQTGVDGYNMAKGGGDEDQADIPDLITDLLHLAVSKGLNPEAVLKRAKINFEAEK